MVPAMLHMFVFIVIPIVIGLVISFFNYNPLSSDNKFIGLENFVRLVQDADFRKALLNTLLFVLITVTLNIGIALVVAQMISWFKSNKVSKFFPYGYFSCRVLRLWLQHPLYLLVLSSRRQQDF